MNSLTRITLFAAALAIIATAQTGCAPQDECDYATTGPAGMKPVPLTHKQANTARHYRQKRDFKSLYRLVHEEVIQPGLARDQVVCILNHPDLESGNKSIAQYESYDKDFNSKNNYKYETAKKSIILELHYQGDTVSEVIWTSYPLKDKAK